MMLLPDNTTFDLGGLSPSQISTPVNRRITRQMSNSVGKGGGLTVEGDEANTVHAAAANRVASASKSSSMENFIPLTPRLLVKSYKSQGFFEPPVTIDETIDLTDEPQTPVQKKRPINQNSNVRKAPSSRKKPAKKRRKDVTLEDGEILDDTVDEEVQIIGDVVKSPEVVIIHDALDSNRSQSPKKTPKWKKLYKNAKSKISSRRVRWEGSKNPTGSRGRKSNRLANAQVNAGSKNSYNLNPVPTFNPNAAPNTNFTSGLAMVQGGVFHFKGGRDRIVPTMGTRQLSTKTMHGMSNVYVPTPDKSANQSG